MSEIVLTRHGIAQPLNAFINEDGPRVLQSSESTFPKVTEKHQKTSVEVEMPSTNKDDRPHKDTNEGKFDYIPLFPALPK